MTGAAFRPSAWWRKQDAAHKRALAAPMHDIPLTGDPGIVDRNFTTGRATNARSHTRRRAILWATWKARKLHGLPENLTAWTVSARECEGTGAAWTVTLEPYGDARQAWKTVSVEVPAWPIASEPEELPEPMPEAAPAAMPEDAPAAPAKPRRKSTARPAWQAFALPPFARTWERSEAAHGPR